jgi:hypothetical protein
VSFALLVWLLVTRCDDDEKTSSKGNKETSEEFLERIDREMQQEREEFRHEPQQQQHPAPSHVNQKTYNSSNKYEKIESVSEVISLSEYSNVSEREVIQPKAAKHHKSHVITN